MHRIESLEIDPHRPRPSTLSRPHQASVHIVELRLRDSLVSGPEPRLRCECHLGSPSLHNITRLFIPLSSAAIPPPLHLYPNTSTCGMTSNVKAPFLLGNQASLWYWDLQPLSCDHCIRSGGGGGWRGCGKEIHLSYWWTQVAALSEHMRISAC